MGKKGRKKRERLSWETEKTQIKLTLSGPFESSLSIFVFDLTVLNGNKRKVERNCKQKVLRKARSPERIIMKG